LYISQSEICSLLEPELSELCKQTYVLANASPCATTELPTCQLILNQYVGQPYLEHTSFHPRSIRPEPPFWYEGVCVFP
jgi:hypothetical protein